MPAAVTESAAVASIQHRGGRVAGVAGMTRQCHLLHVFPSFGLGGVPIRIANIVNLLGPSYRHTIIAMNSCYDAKARLSPDLDVAFRPPPPPGLNPVRMVGRLRAILCAVRPDLLLTYNWGSIEWALANRLFSICPHVHFESGFGVEEADGQLRRRALFRRLALQRTARLVVPSLTLVRIASRIWKLDPGMIMRIPNGVDWRRFAVTPEPGAIPGFQKGARQVVVGTVAPLRPEKNLSRLLRAFAALETRIDTRLLIVGDGPERASLEALATSLGIAARTVFSGHIEGVEKVLRWFDIFAMSSDTEQMPNSLLQAMAAGLPVAATDVGDIKHILAAENAPFVVPKDDPSSLTDALQRLVEDPETRTQLGACNQRHVRASYSLEKMLAAYRNLFEICLSAGPLDGLGRNST